MNAIDQIQGWRDLCCSHLFILLMEAQRLLELHTGWEGVSEAQAGAEGSHA